MHSGAAGDGVIVSLCHSKAQEGNPYDNWFEITADPLSRRGRNKRERHDLLQKRYTKVF